MRVRSVQYIDGLVTAKELAGRLGVRPNTLFYRIQRGDFPEPEVTVPGKRRRYYAEETAAKLVVEHNKVAG